MALIKFHLLKLSVKTQKSIRTDKSISSVNELTTKLIRLVIVTLQTFIEASITDSYKKTKKSESGEVQDQSLDAKLMKG